MVQSVCVPPPRTCLRALSSSRMRCSRSAASPVRLRLLSSPSGLPAVTSVAGVVARTAADPGRETPPPSPGELFFPPPAELVREERPERFDAGRTSSTSATCWHTSSRAGCQNTATRPTGGFTR